MDTLQPPLADLGQGDDQPQRDEYQQRHPHIHREQDRQPTPEKDQLGQQVQGQAVHFFQLVDVVAQRGERLAYAPGQRTGPRALEDAGEQVVPQQPRYPDAERDADRGLGQTEDDVRAAQQEGEEDDPTQREAHPRLALQEVKERLGQEHAS